MPPTSVLLPNKIIVNKFDRIIKKKKKKLCKHSSDLSYFFFLFLFLHESKISTSLTALTCLLHAFSGESEINRSFRSKGIISTLNVISATEAKAKVSGLRSLLAFNFLSKHNAALSTAVKEQIIPITWHCYKTMGYKLANGQRFVLSQLNLGRFCATGRSRCKEPNSFSIPF